MRLLPWAIAALLLVILWDRTAVAIGQPVFTEPLVIQLANPNQPAIIIDATGSEAHGAWIQMKVKCYNPAPGLLPPCEFGGLEVVPSMPDGSLRGIQPAQLFYSPTSQSWDRYTTEGCSVWETANFTYWCGPNGHTLWTKTGGLRIEPWRDLALAPNRCAREGAGCPPDAYHTYASGQLTVGDCDNAAAGRLFTVCGYSSGNALARIINEGPGGVSWEWIAGNHAASTYQSLGPTGLWTSP